MLRALERAAVRHLVALETARASQNRIAEVGQVKAIDVYALTDSQVVLVARLLSSFLSLADRGETFITPGERRMVEAFTEQRERIARSWKVG